VALDIRGDVVRQARIAVGGVATVPWRLPAVEQALIGRPATAKTWTDAAMLAGDGAEPLAENGFKVELIKRTVARQLVVVGGMR
jgi:xanthine dehydrogenase YagS FAD-binding subunit